MGFNENWPGIPWHNTNPPPAYIAALAALIRIDDYTVSLQTLTNQYLFQYRHSPLTAIGYFYVCLRDGENIQALFSLNEVSPANVEIARMASKELKVYYHGMLMADWTEALVADTSYHGYIVVLMTGYNWLSPWGYRKRMTIAGTTAGAQTDYQMKVIVNRSTGSDSGNTVYVGTKCNADFSDLRFTAYDGSTQLSYWVESVVGTVATVWVKFGAIPISPGVSYFYLYYGNAAAATASSGTNTFLFFDDCSGTLTDKWTVNSGTWAYVSGELRHSGGNTWTDITCTKTDFPVGLKVELKLKMSALTWVTAHEVWIRSSSGVNDHYEIHIAPLDPTATSRWAIWPFSGGAYKPPLVGQNHAYTAGAWIKVSQSVSGASQEATIDDASQNSASDANISSGSYLRLREWAQVGQYNYLDDIRAMNYVAPEPVITGWNAEATP